DELTIRIDSIEGLITGPVKRPLPLRGENVVVGTAPEVGSRLSVTVGDEGEWVSLDVAYALPAAGADEEILTARATLHEVRPESLAELGLSGAESLTGPVSGELSARGPLDAL